MVSRLPIRGNAAYGVRARLQMPCLLSCRARVFDMTRPPCRPAGLSTAVRVAVRARQQGSIGSVLVVLITDGRANVSLAQSNEVRGRGANPRCCKAGLPGLLSGASE